MPTVELAELQFRQPAGLFAYGNRLDGDVVNNAPVTIALWWACWIVANATGLIAFRIALEMGKEAMAATSGLGLASEIFTIPAALLLSRLVAGIQAMQERAGAIPRQRDRL